MDIQINKAVAIPAGVGIGSAAIGFVAGYFFHKWQLEREVTRFEAQIDEYEEEQTRLFTPEVINRDVVVHQTIVVHEDEPVTHVVMEETDEELVITFQDDPDEPMLETVNIFTNQDPEWNFEVEVANRSDDKPYVIHVEEFINEESGHNQRTLMFYEGDSVLCDEHNVPIYNAPELVGDNLKFGHGSRDPSIVYVRNTKFDAEYEVIKDEGHYTIEVLGAEIEDTYESQDLKHSHSPHKFRE